MAGKIGVFDDEEIEIAVRPPAALSVRPEEHHALWFAGAANPGDNFVQ
jgi:hypothetical protein